MFINIHFKKIRSYTDLLKMILHAFRRVLLFFFLTFHIQDAFADYEQYDSLKRTGDCLQIINPVIAAGFALQEKGLGHFGIVYGQTLAFSYGIKAIAKHEEWEISKRPYTKKRGTTYSGMPSIHTTSAWAAASYVRTFSDDYKYLSIPLYLIATITGYSRIHAKKHTNLQVFAGATLAETVNFANSQLAWSKDYQTRHLTFYYYGNKVGFQFNL